MTVNEFELAVIQWLIKNNDPDNEVIWLSEPRYYDEKDLWDVLLMDDGSDYFRLYGRNGKVSLFESEV